MTDLASFFITVTALTAVALIYLITFLRGDDQ